MTDNLRLFAEATWSSPWVLHAMVALEEKGLQYEVEVVPLPIPEARRAELRAKAVMWKVPILVHGEAWITESMAISEYLAERFSSSDGFPRLFPQDLAVRARARQVMSALRTGFFELRAERPTSTIFGPPRPAKLSEKAQAEADELVRIATALVAGGGDGICGPWCIADADLALFLQRLVANGDPLPGEVVRYAARQWGRPSVQKFVAHAAAKTGV